jgi:predicted nucleic acid-binding protein
MSDRYIADAYAWVEYLDGTPRGEKLRDILESGADVYTCTVTPAEGTSKAARTGRDPETAYAVIHGNSTITPADEQLSRSAGLLHAEARRTIHDFGLADAYVLATARTLHTRILTGDPHFKDIPEATTI